MTSEDFRASLQEETPPAGLSVPLRALWFDGRGDWNRAHDTLQDDDSAASAWVHAYLHRKEGDVGNARYWYGRASRPEARVSLDDEWDAIVRALLAAA